MGVTDWLALRHQALMQRCLPLRCIPKPRLSTSASALQALTAAALALPGLAPVQAAGSDNRASMQYGFYQEGERALLSSYQTLKLQPIRVDNLQLSASQAVTDRLRLGINLTQDTWSGATPLTSAPAAAMTLLSSGASMAIQSGVVTDKQGRSFYRYDDAGQLLKDSRVVHMMTMASPETRKQVDTKLGYEWNAVQLDVGGGVSVEDDYHSGFVNSHGRWDFNQKRTTLNWGGSYADTDIKAQRDLQYAGYIDYATLFDRQFLAQRDASGQLLPLRGHRSDGSVNLGLSQILSKYSVLEGGVSYTQSNGFLENPYKVAELIYIDPRQQADAAGRVFAQTQGVAERRPDERQQWTVSSRWMQVMPRWDAAAHLGYRFYNDDWGIQAHTFDADWAQPLGHGWTLTPRVRYYSQTAADFYQPYFVVNQARAYTANFAKDYSGLPMANFSSDQRLAGFGAISGGMTLSKQFAKGITLDTGFEYYSHQSGLQLGGGADTAFADFDYFLVNASLKVELSAVGKALDAGSSHRHHTADHRHAVNPAGIQFDHLLAADDVMVGYRYAYQQQSGALLAAGQGLSDRDVVNGGCGGSACRMRPLEHSMHMHMLDIMYAPRDGLTLMLMPQWMDMTMALSGLAGAPAANNGNSGHVHAAGDSMAHATGGLGDTDAMALIRLAADQQQQWLWGVGVSMPTGDVHQQINGRSFVHYGMQLGSGTWDVKSTLTYSDSHARWSWGAQLAGVSRLDQRNSAGYALGDLLQSTAWGSYGLFDGLSASLRGLYSVQQAIQGGFNGPHSQDSPVDFPHNYGGQFWDVGLGINANIQRGHQLAVEWLQPVDDGGNGLQLQRQGTLNASWRLTF